jgi:hypothetical protein
MPLAYEAIIAKASRQRLVTVVPHLRLLPAPVNPPELMSDTEILAWARQRGQARGYQAKQEAERSNEDTRNLRNQSGVWYLDITINGQRTTRSLETHDLEEARRRRDEIHQGRRALRPGRSVSVAEQSRRVLAALAKAPAGAKRIAHLTGLSPETVHRRFRDLLAAGAVHKIEHGLWSLTSTPVPAGTPAPGNEDATSAPVRFDSATGS